MEPCRQFSGRRPEPRLDELIERPARLPKVDDAPTVLDRASRVKDQPLGGIAVNVHRSVKRVVLVLCCPYEFDSETDRHRATLPAGFGEHTSTSSVCHRRHAE